MKGPAGSVVLCAFPASQVLPEAVVQKIGVSSESPWAHVRMVAGVGDSVGTRARVSPERL